MKSTDGKNKGSLSSGGMRMRYYIRICQREHRRSERSSGLAGTRCAEELHRIIIYLRCTSVSHRAASLQTPDASFKLSWSWMDAWACIIVQLPSLRSRHTQWCKTLNEPTETCVWRHFCWSQWNLQCLIGVVAWRQPARPLISAGAFMVHTSFFLRESENDCLTYFHDSTLFIIWRLALRSAYWSLFNKHPSAARRFLVHAWRARSASSGLFRTGDDWTGEKINELKKQSG